ncbi:MAG TPA: putative metal-binding protein [Puia sp.]|jgi:hypothetical protein|nr:putative metal-binding protein [Puia sp.]
MQIVDPLVSRSKFGESVERFIQVEKVQRVRGISLLKAEFPDIYLQFAAPQLTPPPIMFTICFNFDNYDLEPISVRFVHPFTLQPLPQSPFGMVRAVANAFGVKEMMNLIQQDPGGPPFLCIPGTREYHRHPAHTGDDWLLHRNKGGEGTLGFLVDKIYEFGVSAVAGYQVTIQAQIPAVGIALDINKVPT